MTDLVRRSVRVTGVVQGVGYRPFAFGRARGLGLTGFIGNDSAGVFAEVQGPADSVEAFLADLRTGPPLARVDDVTAFDIGVIPESGFIIVASDSGEGTTSIPPDTAICADCRSEMADPADRRYRYPFTACTHCGPRYTIVTGLPYDRPFTTMADFPLCDLCAREYADPDDRRFHAQPTACPACGPRLSFNRTGAVGDAALADAIAALQQGEIVAIKGLGGYHLACDARNTEAVERLRERKQRGSKPFAVMVADVSTAQRIADIDEALATSPEAPIVLGDARDLALRDAVAPGQSRVGVMLPYSGIHHLLFSPHPTRLGDWVPEALVMTSGNLADEPICIDAADAELRLTGIADAFLHHDRGIHVSCDDSVVCADGQPVRRSRGFAPLPVHLPRQARPTLAVGGELKTTLCVASGSRAWMSQHIGDTANLETLDLLARTADTLTELVRVHPEVIVADMHPAYLSRRWADERARQTGAELRLVQHHHAHVASLMAEHGIASDEPIIGFAFDGTGFGRDGSIWGGEVLLATYAQADRIGHLAPVSLPGGDAAIRRPTRTALAHLYAAGIAWDDDLPAVSASDDTERRVIGRMVLTGTGCTPTTSMGRLFDAVSSLLGVCQDTAYEGQAAIELEALAGSEGPRWDFSVAEGPEGGLILDPRPALGAAVGGLRAGVPTADLAFAFHAAVADAVAEAAAWARDRHGVSRVGLTGGVFANRLLTRLCQERLRGLGMTPLIHRTVPPNDGGLALGQAAVAAAS